MKKPLSNSYEADDQSPIGSNPCAEVELPSNDAMHLLQENALLRNKLQLYDATVDRYRKTQKIQDKYLTQQLETIFEVIRVCSVDDLTRIGKSTILDIVEHWSKYMPTEEDSE
tara:strand:+ start:1340 stop:1678 length:339 start_codon:yes stop_codon:yes gene_type:complete